MQLIMLFDVLSTLSYAFTGTAWNGRKLPDSVERRQTPSSEEITAEPASVKDRIKDLLPEQLEAKRTLITVIASDVDGTLLSTDHTLSAKTASVLRRVIREVSLPNGRIAHFFPATGKTRRGALNSLGPEMGDLLNSFPGVFLQGLYCVDGNGTVVFEQKLPAEVVSACEEMAAQWNVTIIANMGDKIYCNPSGDAKLLNDVNALWGEPVPIAVNSLAGPPTFHRIVFLSDDVRMLQEEMRPSLEILARQHKVTVTTSHPTVLEVLPDACSKAQGVRKLCQALGVDPESELLALGDAENDQEMLQMAALGVAMANGCPIAKGAADIELVETSNEGGAGFAMERYSPLGTEAAPTNLC